LHIFEGLAS